MLLFRPAFVGVVTFLATLSVTLLAETPAMHSPQVIAYLFPRESLLAPGQVHSAKLTRINYAFANIADGQVVEGFTHDRENFATLRQLRQGQPGLKLLISVGGWSWSKHFSDVALTTGSRQRFAASAAAFVQRYDLDGVDIDWEYPGLAGDNNLHRPEDRANYTLLLRALREQLDAAEPRAGRHLLLSVATNGTQDFLDHTDMPAVAGVVDTVNLMAYDMAGWGSTTGHHAPLLANPLGPAHVSAQDYVQAYLRAGVPAGKIVLGIPFYGKGWTGVGPDRNGLFQPGTPAPKLELGYGTIASTLLAPGSGFQRFWDSAAESPYLYNATSKTWVDYEDPQSAELKAKYVLDHRLGGIMFWEYSHDPSGVLVDAIDKGLHRGPHEQALRQSRP